MESFKGGGLVLTRKDDLVAVNMDNCFDANGELTEKAARVVKELDTYTEVSPSGKGLRLIARGRLPEGRRRSGKLEMYDCDRFVTITGNVYGGEKTVENRTEELLAVHSRELGGGNGSAAPSPPPEPVSEPPRHEDEEVLEAMFKSKNGAKLQKLYDGDNSDYDDDKSRGDLALMGGLAFFTNYHPEQAERLFRASKRV